MAAGVLQDAAGNGYGGLSGSEYYFDVADSGPIAPVLSPAHASAGASKSSAIVLTFSEGIQVRVCAGMCSALWRRIVNDGWWIWQAGTGNIVLTSSGGTSANLALTIPVADAQVVISGAVCTIQPTNDLDDRGGKR